MTSYQGLLIFVSDPSLARDSLGAPLVELLGVDVDGLREENLFREVQSIDATPGSSPLIVLLLGLGRRAHRGLSLVRLLDEEEPQDLFDDGLLVRELAVLDLLSKEPLKIVCESDVHHRESCQSWGLGWPPCMVPFPSIPQEPRGWQNRGRAY